MWPSILDKLNPDLIKFILVVVFALLIGLEQRRRHLDAQLESLFGTDRTFTLIGILGFILYKMAPQTLIPFLGGGAMVSLFLAVFYFQKASQQHKFGITAIVTALVTYCLAPMLYTEPQWLVLLVVVSVLVITEIKQDLLEFSKQFGSDEFITLAKFMALAGIILPLLPDQPISPEINISPYRAWLAVVVVSGISYASYLLKKFVFPNAGLLLTGVLGGLYSSTATTVILARKSEELGNNNQTVAAIFLATTMMYVRILLLAFFFNQAIAIELLPYFSGFIVLSLAISFVFYKWVPTANANTRKTQGIKPQDNPLEFKTALVFAGLFILFALATGYVVKNYGGKGINLLSLIVGVTDIDPFILNLFQSKWEITNLVITVAVINAITSNNLLKMGYGVFLSDKSLRKYLIIGFSILIAAGLVLSFTINS